MKQRESADRDECATQVDVERVGASSAADSSDLIAVEEPMEIRLLWGAADKRRQQSLSVTMRTPGQDLALAAGFLFTEGIVQQADQIARMEFCGPPTEGRATSNIVRVELEPTVELDLARLQRNFFTTSSCGICGKASLDAVEVQGVPLEDAQRPTLDEELIHRLPEKLLEEQSVFERTGGLHAAALFDDAGKLLGIQEDVGRHNAVDKLIGVELTAGRLPLLDRVMMVSGRTSFEILQKALTAGIPVVVAVGAPSSLAVELARRFGMTLVGFARDRRYNIYAGAQRIRRRDT